MKFYSTSSKGIGGKIKRRYSDFVVEEIQSNGRICRVERFDKDELTKKTTLKVPKNNGKLHHLHLDLEKINKELNFVIAKLSRFLQCSKKRIGYAGIKDKRAITCQRISIFEPNIKRLQSFSTKGILLKNPSWEKERIEIGELYGNRFTVIIRGIDLNEKELRERIENCFSEMKKGIANYFGEQRFGGIRRVTHLVGKEFLKGNFENGVMLYLTSTYVKEDEEVKRARINLAESMDFSKASKEFPVKLRFERSMIHHLCKYPRDFVGAFRKLPKPMRYLFTHAFQSYLFNKVIDKRFEEGIGIKKQHGDICLNGLPTAPLYGFETKFACDKIGEIEKEVLEEEGISLEQFKVKKMSELSSKGTRKEIVLKPMDLKLLKIEEDEFFEEKLAAKISFSLTKGNYATTVLRELMKTELD